MYRKQSRYLRLSHAAKIVKLSHIAKKKLLEHKLPRGEELVKHELHGYIVSIESKKKTCFSPVYPMQKSASVTEGLSKV